MKFIMFQIFNNIICVRGYIQDFIDPIKALLNSARYQKTRSILWTLGLCMQLSIVHATWIVVKIDNQSDLVFTQAARNNDVEIESISQILKKPQNSDTFYLDKNSFFGSTGGCKIIAQIPQGNQVAIAFFGDPRHRVAKGRTNADCTDLDSRNAAAALKSSMLARVFMMQDGIMKLIGFTGYEDMNQQFALTLIGSDGNYNAMLTLC